MTKNTTLKRWCYIKVCFDNLCVFISSHRLLIRYLLSNEKSSFCLRRVCGLFRLTLVMVYLIMIYDKRLIKWLYRKDLESGWNPFFHFFPFGKENCSKFQSFIKNVLFHVWTFYMVHVSTFFGLLFVEPLLN